MNCADIEAFVESGGDVNAFQTYEHHVYPIPATKSLLERAVELGCVEAVRLLIDKGATLRHEPVEDFYVDRRPRYEPLRTRLVPLYVMDEEHFDGNCSLFIWSLFFTDLEVIQILYDAFVAPCEESVRKETIFAAMMMAMEIGSLDVMRFLLDHGGKPLLNDGSLFPSPFHHACYHDDIEMVKFLLDEGGDLNDGNPEDGYPLMSAIHSKVEEVALLLIERGADVSVEITNRAKPLSLARRRKLKRVVAAIKARLKTDTP